MKNIKTGPNRKYFGDKSNDVAQKLKFVYVRIENSVEKGEKAGYKHFLLFSTLFSKGFFFRVVKSQDCVVKSIIMSSAKAFYLGKSKFCFVLKD